MILLFSGGICSFQGGYIHISIYIYIYISPWPVAIQTSELPIAFVKPLQSSSPALPLLVNRHQCFTRIASAYLGVLSEYVHQQKCREESVESWWVEHPLKKKQLQYFTSPTHTQKKKKTPQNHHLAIQCLPRAFTRSPTNTPPKRVSFRSKRSGPFRNGAFTAWPAFHAAVPPVPSRHQDAARRLTFRTDQVARRRRIHGEAPRLGGNPRFQTPETVWGVCVCVWFSVYLKEMAVF